MTTERHRRDFALHAETRGERLMAPGWYLRLKLRWLDQSCAQVERQLDAEFATLETAPMHADLEALRAEREALRKRLLARR